MISIWRLRCDMNCRYQIMFSAIRIAISRPHYSISQIIGHQIFVTVITCIRCFIWRIDSISRNFSQNDFSSKTSPEDTMCDMRWSFIRLSIFGYLTFFFGKKEKLLAQHSLFYRINWRRCWPMSPEELTILREGTGPFRVE